MCFFVVNSIFSFVFFCSLNKNDKVCYYLTLSWGCNAKAVDSRYDGGAESTDDEEDVDDLPKDAHQVKKTPS